MLYVLYLQTNLSSSLPVPRTGATRLHSALPILSEKASNASSCVVPSNTTNDLDHTGTASHVEGSGHKQTKLQRYGSQKAPSAGLGSKSTAAMSETQGVVAGGGREGFGRKVLVAQRTGLNGAGSGPLKVAYEQPGNGVKGDVGENDQAKVQVDSSGKPL